MTRPITCRDGVRLLVDFTEGRLSATVRRDVEAHVAACPSYQGFVRSYCATPRILREATAPALPTRVADRLRRAVRALPDRPRRPRGR